MTNAFEASRISASSAHDFIFRKEPHRPNEKICSNETVEEFGKLSDLLTQKVTNQHGAQNIADHILSRIGIFDQKNIPLDQLHICNAHYEELGEQWTRKTIHTLKHTRASLKCGIKNPLVPPKHTQPAVAAASRRFIQKKESAAIWKETGVFIPLGTRKYLYTCCICLKRYVTHFALFF